MKTHRFIEWERVGPGTYMNNIGRVINPGRRIRVAPGITVTRVVSVPLRLSQNDTKPYTIRLPYYQKWHRGELLTMPIFRNVQII